MSLAELRLEDLRCLRQAELELDPRLNLISGPNGSGKTTLLEAIYLLGRGRSFRSRSSEQLIRTGAERCWVFGRTTPEPGHTLGFEYDRAHRLQLRIDREAANSRAALSAILPVQIIDPDIHRLVDEGPVQRRRWLDWAVFHVEPQFLPHWQGYARALRQRNAALQRGQDTAPWDLELVRHGEPLAEIRARVLGQLEPHWLAVRGALGAVEATWSFQRGWARDLSLQAALERQRHRDRERGTTSVGPHRFDVLLRLEGRPAREIVSRGQQKLLGVALAVAVTRYLGTVTERLPTVLLDDPAAELDSERTAALLGLVRTLNTQLVVTAIRPEFTPIGTPEAVFHVERGEVKRL